MVRLPADIWFRQHTESDCVAILCGMLTTPAGPQTVHVRYDHADLDLAHVGTCKDA